MGRATTVRMCLHRVLRAAGGAGADAPSAGTVQDLPRAYLDTAFRASKRLVPDRRQPDMRRDIFTAI
jgi:hypothetical protein